MPRRDWLRTGTTKLPLFHGAPLIGGDTRNWLDVGVYAAVQLTLLYALFQSEITATMLVPVIVGIPLLGVLDKTLFLAARFEHYTVALICLVFVQGDDLWVSACKMVWSFIWFWAAMSKVNHHFPGVIMVMMNNGPFFPEVPEAEPVPQLPRRPAPLALRGHHGPLRQRHRVRHPRAALSGHRRHAAHRALALPDDELPPLHRAEQPERHADRVEHPDDLRRLVPVRVRDGAGHEPLRGVGEPAARALPVLHAHRGPHDRELLPALRLVPALHALLRRQLGLQRMAAAGRATRRRSSTS